MSAPTTEIPRKKRQPPRRLRRFELETMGLPSSSVCDPRHNLQGAIRFAVTDGRALCPMIRPKSVKS